MPTAVQQLLESFDALPDADKHRATVEILRRALPAGDVPESALIEAAEELFLARDTEEADGQPVFGSCKGMLAIISEDDEHLKDFDEYMK